MHACMHSEPSVNNIILPNMLLISRELEMVLSMADVAYVQRSQVQLF